MSKLDYQTILDITTHFYTKAPQDILIGFHFRIIKDFETHIPRIADFWELQLTGKMKNRESLPFKLLEVHRPMKLTYGQVNRWVVLFHESLDLFLKEDKITEDDKEKWKAKIEIFKSKIIMLSRASCS